MVDAADEIALYVYMHTSCPVYPFDSAIDLMWGSSLDAAGPEDPASDDWSLWELCDDVVADDTDDTAGDHAWNLTQRDWSVRVTRSAERRGGSTGPLAAAVAILCVVLAANPRPAAAQMPSLVELSAQYMPGTEIGGTRPMQDAQISSYQLSLNVPIQLSARSFLIPGFTYRLDSIALAHASDGTTHDELHAPGASALFIQLLPGRWSASVRGAVSFAGSLGTTVDRRMIEGGLLALASRSITDDFTIGAGALLSAGFGEVHPLPVLSVRWKPAAAAQLELFAPVFASARYTAWNRIEIGARTEVSGTTYAIRDASTRQGCAGSATEAMAAPDACFDHVTYLAASAGLLTGVRLTSTLWLTTYAGLAFYRHADQRNRSGETIPGGGDTLPRAGFVRTSLVWRLPGT